MLPVAIAYIVLRELLLPFGETDATIDFVEVQRERQ